MHILHSVSPNPPRAPCPCNALLLILPSGVLPNPGCIQEPLESPAQAGGGPADPQPHQLHVPSFFTPLCSQCPGGPLCEGTPPLPTCFLCPSHLQRPALFCRAPRGGAQDRSPCSGPVREGAARLLGPWESGMPRESGMVRGGGGEGQGVGGCCCCRGLAGLGGSLRIPASSAS